MLIRRQPPPKPAWKWPENKPKPRLPMVHLPHYRVHCSDLEQYLETVYRVPEFNFCAATGHARGMAPEYIVTGQLPPAWESRNAAERIRNGQRSNNVQLILNVLCLDGFIPAGHYTMDTRPKTPLIERYRALLDKHGDPLAYECIQFREKHSGDKEFAKKAAVLDSAIAKWLRSQ